MPRPEQPLHDSEHPAVVAFAAELRSLRHGARTPSYREMSEQAHYSVSVLSRAASGEKLPTWNVTKAFVLACGGEPEDWRERWKAAHAALLDNGQPKGDPDTPRTPLRAIRDIDILLAALRRRMQEEGRSYRDLARATGYPTATVHNLLNGRSALKREYLENILHDLYPPRSKDFDGALAAFDKITERAQRGQPAVQPTVAKRRTQVRLRRRLSFGAALLVLVMLVVLLGAGLALRRTTTDIARPHAGQAPRSIDVGGLTVLVPAVPPRGPRDDAGRPIAMLRQPLTVSVRSASGQRPAPRRVIPAPCAYYRVWTGAELAGESRPDLGPDSSAALVNIYNSAGYVVRQVALPREISAIESVRDDFTDNPYDRQGAGISAAAMAVHGRDTTGYWWVYRCNLNALGARGSDERKLALLAAWHAQVSNQWEFWRPGQERFPANVPIDPLTVIANLQAAVNNLAVYFNPAPAASMVGLMTWTSVEDSSRGPLEVTLTAGRETVTAQAKPGPLHTSATRPIPNVDLTYFICADGGLRYNAARFKRLPSDHHWYCGLFFDRAGTYTLQFSQDWTLTIAGRPLAGQSGSLTRTSPPYTFTVTPIYDADAANG